MSYTQELKISVPEGKKAVYDEATQTIKFVDAEPVRSKTWEEFCNNHDTAINEWKLTGEGVTTYLSPVSRFFAKDALATKEDAEGILALIQLKRLHDEWVGDWKPNYTDSTDKWHIYFLRNNVGITWTTSGKRLLAFPTQEMANEFMICFKDLIEQAKMFI